MSMLPENWPSFFDLIRGFFVGLKTLKGLVQFGTFLGSLGAGAAKVLSWLNMDKMSSLLAERQRLKENRRPFDELAKAPRCSIEQARVGEIVQLEGRARHEGELLVSPVGKRECVFYDVVVEQRIIADQGAVEVFRAREAVEFFVEDSTGRVKIDTNTLELDIDFDSSKRMDASVAQALLQKHGAQLAKGKWTRVKERTIAPFHHISICGLVQKESDPTAVPMDGGYRQDRPNRLTLEPASKQFVLVTERRIAHEHED